MTAPASALLPCPFCGEQPTMRVSFASWLVECKCGADGPSIQRALVPNEHGSDMDDERAAKIEAWNRRAHLAAGSGEDEAAERAREECIGRNLPANWKP